MILEDRRVLVEMMTMMTSGDQTRNEALAVVEAVASHRAGTRISMMMDLAVEDQVETQVEVQAAVLMVMAAALEELLLFPLP